MIAADGSRDIEGVLVMKDSGLKLVAAAEAATELGLGQHTLEFRSTMTLPLPKETTASALLEFTRAMIADKVPEVREMVVVTDVDLTIHSIVMRCKGMVVVSCDQFVCWRMRFHSSFL
jgi:hypothetical protein